MRGWRLYLRRLLVAITAAACGPWAARDQGATFVIPVHKEALTPTVRWSLDGASLKSPMGPMESRPEVVHEDVYPGIALTLRRHGGAMVYQFDVAPGGDPGAIRMRYEGVDDVRPDPGQAGLRLRSGDTLLVERGLRCSQEGPPTQDVRCSYRVARESARTFSISLDVGPFDRSRRLVIDPEIRWSTYLGGTGQDGGLAAAVDGVGSLYVTGQTQSSDFPTNGGFDSTLDWAADAYVSKISADGALEWSSFIGGSASETGEDIAVDASGNVYLLSSTGSTDFPEVGGFDGGPGGAGDAFVTSLDPSGSGLLWSSRLGGSSTEEPWGMAVDELGNIYVTGDTQSYDFPTVGGFDDTLAGNPPQDAFVTKIDASGLSLVWSSYLGGETGFGDDTGIDIAVDPAGNVYVTGYTRSPDFPSTGGFDTTFDGGITEDAFVTKIAASGARLLWSSFLGGSAADHGDSVIVDAWGNAVVSGTTESSDFPVIGGVDTTLGGTADAFIAKVAADGSGLLWASFVGGSGLEDGAAAASLDTMGNVYLVGRTESTDFPTIAGFDGSLGGIKDAYVTKTDATSSTVVWSSYLGGSEWDGGNALVLGSGGRTYVVGVTESTDFPGSGGFDSMFNGVNDTFVAQITECDADGLCDTIEDACSCSVDCGTDTCGNGCCGSAEDTCTCPADCPGDCCGDGICGFAESACMCADCTTAVCGDGCCADAEACDTCSEDCGACGEPALDLGSGDLGPMDDGGDGGSSDAGASDGTGGGADAAQPDAAPDVSAADLGAHDGTDVQADADRDMAADGRPDAVPDDAGNVTDGVSTSDDEAARDGETRPTGGSGADGCSCSLGGGESIPGPLLLLVALSLIGRRRPASRGDSSEIRGRLRGDGPFPAQQPTRRR